MISPLFEPTDVIGIVLGLGFLLLLTLARGIRWMRNARAWEKNANYWEKRATFFERQAYELLRTRPLFRRDDADWWKE